MLLGEQFAFAQKANNVGASVTVEVFEGMYHDWMQESEGCGSSRHLLEGVKAIERAGEFQVSTAVSSGVYQR